MNGRVFGIALLLTGALIPNAAFGQGDERAWGPGTTLSVFAGAAAPDSTVSGAAGGSIGWEFTPYLAIEGTGAWMAKSTGAKEFAAVLGPRFSLLPPRKVVPTVFAGVGMLRSTVDVNDTRLPEFYGRRLDVPSAQTTKVFQDVAFAVGGGADIFVNHRLAIRPDVRVLFARADSDTRVLPIFGVHVSYHFEPHPYLP